MGCRSLDQIVALSRRRGFVFGSSEIYSGLSSVYDYGPLGVELKMNIKEFWWRVNVRQRRDMEGLDAAILMHPRTWEASGHLEGFRDALVDCKSCKKRFRLDHLESSTRGGPFRICPQCRAEIDIEKNPARTFNLMLETHLGPVKDDASITYLRPETAQGIFVNFLNILNSRHRRLPFGIAQIGKAFRNEVTTGNFVFRMREFEQMEIEYFVRPGEDEKWFGDWVDRRLKWYVDLGIKRENLRLRRHSDEELAHYAKSCTDIEYNFPFGWSELEGIANRTDFDLRRHAGSSGQDLRFFDDSSGKRFFPYIIEPSAGVDRTFLAIMCDAYDEEEVKGRKRVVLRLSPLMCISQAAVMPLLKNRPDVVDMARKIFEDLKGHLRCVFDDSASIGKLYRRQDEIGTPFCVTVDVESLTDGKVTVRDRDTMGQERLPAEKLKEYLKNRLYGKCGS